MEIARLRQIPGYARALYAIRILSEAKKLRTEAWRVHGEDGRVGVSIDEIVEAMNESKPSTTPDFDTEVASCICRTLVSSGVAAEFAPTSPKQPKLFVLTQAAPVIELSDIPHSMATSGSSSPNGASAKLRKPAPKPIVGETRNPAKPAPKPALPARKNVPSKSAAAKTASRPKPEPPKPAAKKAAAPKPAEAKAEPTSSDKPKTKIYGKEEVAKLLKQKNPQGWFSGDEDWLPADIDRGRFRITCSGLSKGQTPMLERRSAKVDGKYIYEFRLRA